MTTHMFEAIFIVVLKLASNAFLEKNYFFYLSCLNFDLLWADETCGGITYYTILP